MNRLSKLVLAAALASTIPAAAVADDCEHDRDRGHLPPGAWSSPAEYPAYPSPAEYPAYPSSGAYPAYPSPGAYPGYPSPGAYPAYPEPPRPAPREWRHRWREHELAEVSARLRALDAERAGFYAENGWRPGRLRKYERYYRARRAKLEQRWYELQAVAWR